jgi:hypothetical protein
MNELVLTVLIGFTEPDLAEGRRVKEGRKDGRKES